MRLSLLVRGTVQGVGFRPFVRKAALSRGLSGFVHNGRDGVRIEVQGDDGAVAAFTAALRDDKPAAATVVALESARIAERDEPRTFEIVASHEAGPAAPVLPPDLVTCEECWREVRDPADRRHDYPFTSCVACGPRFSISYGLPYDRARTSMGPFELCDACAREYEDVDDRRYHAQPVACPSCGPLLTLQDADGKVHATGTDAITRAARAIDDGSIVALKGLGGFQLACDATSQATVVRLRERKRRPHKPFAVMFPSLRALEGVAFVSTPERALLTSPEGPIVLLERRPGATCLAAAVADESPWIGALLPSTPLHGVLLDRVGRAIVCTSGNLSEEPLATEDADARERLRSIAGLFLTHDRRVVRPLDDSVVRVSRGKTSVLRRARGYAPSAVAQIAPEASVLAFGAHLKSTVSLGHAGAIVPSQHLGDLDSPGARELLRRALRDLSGFFDAHPRLYVCDLHPDYASTRIAEELATEAGVPLLRVQHHHAHVAACMAEHGMVDEEVLGLAWDGTGLGHDGTVWGGEALACKGSSARRVAHLRTFPLPGGDAAVRHPRRAALGLLWEVDRSAFEQVGGPWFGASLPHHARALERGVGSPRCSSIGRLFDAVAALVGIEVSTFEGQAAMALEALARGAEGGGAYPLPLVDGALDPAPLVAAVLADVRVSASRAIIARRFHEALIDAGSAVAEATGIRRVALTGGCFQNRLLAEGIAARLEARGFTVLTCAKVPPNDGGISVGQAWLGAEDARSHG